MVPRFMRWLILSSGRKCPYGNCIIYRELTSIQYRPVVSLTSDGVTVASLPGPVP